MDEKTVEHLEAEESMFVQTAPGVTSDGATLTLQGVTPSTLYFSDRPQRVVGHMATADFVELGGRRNPPPTPRSISTSRRTTIRHGRGDWKDIVVEGPHAELGVHSIPVRHRSA